MKQPKTIEDQIRKRVLEAIEEIATHDNKASYASIMRNLGDYQQSHVQLKEGKRYPTLRNIVLLHEKYHYSINWIMTGSGEKRTNSIPSLLREINRLAKHAEFLLKG